MNNFLIRKDFEGLFTAVQSILKRHEPFIELAIIHGSVATRSATATSDVDLLLVGDVKIKRDVKNDLAEYSATEGIFFDVLFMSPQQFELWKSHPLVQEALINGIILLRKERYKENTESKQSGK